MTDTPAPILAPDTTIAPDGKPDDRDIAAWLLIASITPGDIDAARTLWQTHMPAKVAGMLTGDGWAWDDQTQSYQSRHGRKMHDDDLKSLALLFAMFVGEDLRADASNVAVGIKPLATWQRETADAVKDLYIGEAALASGGFAKLTPPVLERIAGTPDKPPGLSYSLAKLRDFSDAIYQGAPRADSETAIVERAALYAAASQGVYEEVKRDSHNGARDEGGRPLFLFEKNILGSENPCAPTDTTEGCWNLTQSGWQPIGTIPSPGLRSCGPNCACFLKFSLTGNAVGVTL